jgi:hypothetical protein
MKVDLAEVSISPFVINDQAKITDAKADTGEPLSLLHDERGVPLPVRVAEATMREALGLSRAEAKALIAGGYAALAGMAPGGHGDQAQRDAGEGESMALAAFVDCCRSLGALPLGQ